MGMVESGIKHLVSGFTSVSFRHVKRSFNETVHVLAKSCEDVNTSAIFHYIPDCIHGIFCIDVI
jgi:hypothetical protein